MQAQGFSSKHMTTDMRTGLGSRLETWPDLFELSGPARGFSAPGAVMSGGRFTGITRTGDVLVSYSPKCLDVRLRSPACDGHGNAPRLPHGCLVQLRTSFLHAYPFAHR